VHRRARPDEEPKRVKQRDDDRSHESSLPKGSPNLNQLNAYGVSGSHNLWQSRFVALREDKNARDVKRE